MRWTLPWRFVTSCFVLALAAAAPGLPDAAPSDDLRASFDPVTCVSRPGVPLPCSLRLRNLGAVDLDIPANGATLLAETKDGVRLDAASTAMQPLPHRLAPGQLAVVRLDLAARFPGLSTPGRYRITWSHPSFPAPPALEVSIVEPYASLRTSLGEIVIEFHPEDAPKTVENFIALVKKGFYDGLTFHRIIPGFMMQGEDPKGDGTGGPGYTIKAEFNKRKHVAGTVSMARRADPDSAGCQFFICFDAATHLDGQYTAFAQVVRGMDVVKKVEPLGSPSGVPRQKIVMEKVTLLQTLPPEAR